LLVFTNMYNIIIIIIIIIIINVCYVLTIKFGGFNYAFCTIVFLLLVFVYDNLMMVAEKTETCW
jgi:hypothetical protein